MTQISHPYQVIHEDDHLLVINKPAGVVVNAAQTAPGETMQEVLGEQLVADFEQRRGQERITIPSDFDDTYGTPEEIWQHRQGMVHRLDKQTSGALVWAKDPGTLVSLLAAFKQRQVSKTYQCLVHGRFTIEEDTVRLPIGRAQHDRQRMALDPTGRSAETQYQVEESYRRLDLERVAAAVDESALKKIRRQQRLYQAGFSFVMAQPKTGRTHQIRVHMKALQHPIVGDTKYVGKKRAKVDPLWCPRQFLHAAGLRLTHPATNQELALTAPLSDDLQQVLSYLDPDA